MMLPENIREELEGTTQSACVRFLILGRHVGKAITCQQLIYKAALQEVIQGLSFLLTVLALSILIASCDLIEPEKFSF